MAGIAGLPVVDHHCHLSPSGESTRAVARFRAAGGTHLFLATQNYGAGPPLSLATYQQQYETTEQLARVAAQETGVTIYPVLAPFPVDLVGAADALGLEAALELHRAALDLAGRWVRERRAVALGEVGWPHFEVAKEVADAAQVAFRHALAVAKEADCPAVVHSPDLDPSAWVALEGEARRAGLEPRRVVKHYARARRSAAVEVVPSYLARRELVAEVSAEQGPWFLETDFLDDPHRPGAVLDLATIPRRAQRLAAEGSAGIDRLSVPFVRSVERVYGITPEVPDR